MRNLKSIFLLGLLAVVGCGDSESTSKHTGAGGSGGSGGVGGNGATGGDTSAGAVSAGADGGEGGAPGPIPTEAKLTFVPIELALDAPTDFEFVPGKNDEILVTGKNGDITHLRLSGDTAETLATTLLPEVFIDAGCGLLDLAFDPEFASKPYVFMGRCVDGRTTVLSRYRWDDLADLPDTEVEIMRVETDTDPAEFWHRWGSIAFEPDGETMWGLLGDLFFRDGAQDPTSVNGSLLRFRPNREEDGSGYEPADGNAFSDPDEGDPTVYAYGFRSPWRSYRDQAGRFFVGDVGLSTVEEVDFVEEAGQNFGWGTVEGKCKTNCDGFTDPLVSYKHTGEEALAADDPETVDEVRRAIWVGVVYEGESKDRYYGLLDDTLLYGDFFTGWVRGLKVSSDGELDSDAFLGHLTSVTSMRLGPDGYLYALTLGGTLFRVEQVVE